MDYIFTPLEDWILSFYQHINIQHPEDLDIMTIASKYNIWVYFFPVTSHAIERQGKASIVLDERQSAQQQWEDFGHEMCHILRHSGNQLLLSNSLIEFQESKASNFAMHFCIPSFMLTQLNIPNQMQAAIDYVSEIFNVTPSIAKKRLKQYSKQILQQSYNNKFSALMEASDQFKRIHHIEYCIPTGSSTMLYCHEKGVLGYIKEANDDI
ncbi:MAG: ImmA/IrrE family metallo-endopeptidase [Paenibacillaceae bacterium]